MHVSSADGTKIAYDKIGSGPLVILVTGALSTRFSWANLPKLLECEFTVVSYDRRGRGDSTDSVPYSLRREIDDIEALIDQEGGSALLYGISSGGALALEAAAKLGAKRVRKLAIYEVPYATLNYTSKHATQYHVRLKKILSAGDNGEAVALFMKQVGVPDQTVQDIRRTPKWKELEALAPTLVYENLVLGKGFRIPKERTALVSTPTLVMVGGSSPEFMHAAARELKNSISKAQLRVLEGQTHNVKPEALAPCLKEFFQ